MKDVIYRQDAINEAEKWLYDGDDNRTIGEMLRDLPPAQPERLTDDDFETIRIHLNAYKEKLCNQCRWKEAEDYQRLIDRFMSFASAQQKHNENSYQEQGDSDKFGVKTNKTCDDCMDATT